MLIKKVFVCTLVTSSAIFAWFLVWNLDIGLRIWQAGQDGKLTTELLRYELASFDIGRPSPIVPVDTKTSKIDGMPQVYVPEGTFMMGSNKNPDAKEYPEHDVYLDSYWMDKVEVTNAMYLKCLQAKSCTSPVSDNIYYNKWVYRDYPIVYVTWGQSNTYCQWAGRRLPTEAEWEKAARGTDSRIYTWGNERANPRLANFDESLIGKSLPAYRYPLGASPYGILNMSGNVREWVADWFDNKYYEISPKVNPKGPETGTERSLRGGAYDANLDNITTFHRFRHEPDSAGLSRGFRCAESAP
jgi:eukaryotic-like serine/threonine-protein kinase